MRSTMDPVRPPMEASEIAEPPDRGHMGPPLKRIDLDLVRARLSSDHDRGGGFARLDLMLNTILPRLTQTGEKND